MWVLKKQRVPSASVMKPLNEFSDTASGRSSTAHHVERVVRAQKVEQQRFGGGLSVN